MRPARTDNTNITAYARPLIATALVASGLVQLAAPVFAQTVPLPAANSDISNTATATYEDPNVPNTPISTVSNTVTIKVAKVAGILVTAKGYTDVTTADAFKPGDTVYSNFDVKNTGNDGAKFRIPSVADVSNNTTFTEIQYSTNNGTNWTTVTGLTGVDTDVVIPIDGVVKVRVVLTIKSTAISGTDIETTLGNTSTPGAINIERGVGSGESLNNKDIYTVDVLTAGGGVALAGTAANGVREASARQTIQVNAVKQAIPSITLTNGTITPNATTPATKDDVTYNISVTVPTTNPTTGAATADLAPTAIKLATTASPATGTGTDVNRVIISNPLPAGSVLKDPITAPTGWTPVYAITAPTPGTPTIWSVTPPTILADVKQVGFIYEPTSPTTSTTTTLAVPGTSLPAQTAPYTGFSVKITTGSLGTVPNTAAIDGTTPGTTTIAHAEATTPIITSRTAAISTIYNGPAGEPQAQGPGNDNNADFTNKSMQIALADAVRNPATGLLKPTSTASVVSFSNTIENSTNVAGNVYLLPTVPANPQDLPNGTTITIKKSDNTDAHTYQYVLDTNTNTGSFTTTNTGLPLTLSVAGFGLVGYLVEVTLPVGQEQLKGYPVPVTAFTGGTITAGMVKLPVDTADNPATTTVDETAFKPTASNVTIDRVYTGYIDLMKEVRVLDAITQQTSTTIPYVSTPTDVAAIKATPGKFIQYRIRAINKSTPVDSTAVGSKLLDAGKIKIVENGTGTGTTTSGTWTSNWANTTSHAPDSAQSFLDGALQAASTITFKDGTTVTNNTLPNVSRYDVDFGTTAVIAPGKEGSFIFVRQVNKPTP